MNLNKITEICARVGRLLAKILCIIFIFAYFHCETDFSRLDLNRILKLDWFQLHHTIRNFGENVFIIQKVHFLPTKYLMDL